jgi:hypothetical protein
MRDCRFCIGCRRLDRGGGIQVLGVDAGPAPAHHDRTVMNGAQLLIGDWRWPGTIAGSHAARSSRYDCDERGRGFHRAEGDGECAEY